MNETKRFHRELGFPREFEVMIERFLAAVGKVRYSEHAKWETIDDRYHIIPVLQREQLRPEQVFEIFVEGNAIVKAVFRVKGNDGLDNCYSVNNDSVVVTCWTNKADDAHRTLKKELYSRA